METNLEPPNPAPRRQRPSSPHITTLPKPQKNTRANMKVGSLNIQGRGANLIFNPDNKWNKINQLMRDEKVAILAIQEAHLDQLMCEQLNEHFANLTIFTSPDPTNPNARGVAFAINQRISAVGKNMKVSTIIPGRAILLETHWHNDESLHILNIYAPNNMKENQTFWQTLQETWTDPTSTLPFPDILLGDFNITEHPLDRCNGKSNNLETVAALQSLLETFQAKDGWRETYPNTQDFTLLHNGNQHQPRLDRMYLPEGLLNRAHEWNIDDVAIPTDHKLISVYLSIPNTPYIGKGRWSIPNFTLGNRKFLQKIEELGKKLLTKLELLTYVNRLDQSSAQFEWETFKIDIILKEIDAEIRTTNAECFLQDAEKRKKVASLLKEKKEILTLKFQSKRDMAAARNLLEGETVCKYWTSLSKERTSRDLIRKLKIPSDDPDPPNYATRSDKMAEIARDHHDSLQNQDTEIEYGLREDAIQWTLNSINTGLSEEEKRLLGSQITEEDVQTALASAANGKAPGLDGIPYELWKILSKRHIDIQKIGGESFDIVRTLQLVFNNIEKSGVNPTSNFSKGWMCPIFKKGEKTEIANYHPITVLNTDYKLFAKSVQAKLASVSQNLIHHNQAGFMKNRSIINHIHTIDLMTSFAELDLDNEGAIIALDQEKAYDKIKHDYLIRVLRKMNLPEEFINTVQALYYNATTQVMINGVLSNSFKVRRGVRQGDPLSCLLFNLTIEPLACLIRNSSLRGAKIPNLHDCLKVLMFADDTTVFLHKTDKYEDLVKILNKWCTASGAKFNITKTEIIPLGSREYRELFIESRKLSEDHTPIPNGTRITREGEKVRILGAWIGNGGNDNRPWETIKQKVANKLDNWNKINPGTEGRRHALQMTVHGMSQYLTIAQGMPEKTETELTKMASSFLWKSQRARIKGK